MRIGLLHFSGPPVTGGVEGVMAHQATLLAGHGYDVTIIAGRGRRPADARVKFARIPQLAATHPTIRRLAAELAEGRVSRQFSNMVDTITRTLGSLFADLDAILVHNAFTLQFNVPLTAALAQLASRSKPGKLIAWTHDIGAVNELYSSEFHAGFPWILLVSPVPGVRYVCISETRKEELLNLWRMDPVASLPSVSVIPNGIDAADAYPVPKEIRSLTTAHGLWRHDIVLLLPVRITRRKNIELAISAVKDLRDRGHDAILLVTGPVRGHHPSRSRDYLNELLVQARALGVEKRVIFVANELGRSLTPSEVRALYWISTMLIIPSRSEGFGLPLIEAGLYRLPIVASGLPVFREVAGSDAHYFPVDADPAIVADCVEDALAHSALRTRILRDFAWDAIYEAHMKPLLDEIKGAQA